MQICRTQQMLVQVQTSKLFVTKQLCQYAEHTWCGNRQQRRHMMQICRNMLVQVRDSRNFLSQSSYANMRSTLGGNQQRRHMMQICSELRPVVATIKLLRCGGVRIVTQIIQGVVWKSLMPVSITHYLLVICG